MMKKLLAGFLFSLPYIGTFVFMAIDGDLSIALKSLGLSVLIVGSVIACTSGAFKILEE